MTATMLVVAMLADGAAVAGGGVRPPHHRLPAATLPIASLPMGAVAAWPLRRCGDDAPGTQEAAAEAAIDDACPRLVVRDRVAYRPGQARWRGGGGGGGDTPGWRLARAMLPGLEGLQGLVGPGGLGLGIGSELQLVRGAHMTLHLAAARDTRIAASAFAPETTVQARCGACWDTGEAVGAGINGGRRVSASAPDR